MRITVSFDCDVPEEATIEQIDEWLQFELGARWDMRHSPLSESDLEARAGSVTWRGRS